MSVPAVLQHRTVHAIERAHVAEADVAAYATPLEDQTHAIEHLCVSAFDEHHVARLHKFDKRLRRLPRGSSSVDNAGTGHSATPRPRAMALEAFADDEKLRPDPATPPPQCLINGSLPP